MFVISKKWEDSIYKYWKVSERIYVLQLKTDMEVKQNNSQYESEDTNNAERYKAHMINEVKWKFERITPDHIITIVNV